MTHIHRTNGYFTLGLLLALCSGLLVFWSAQAAQAAREDRPGNGPGRDRHFSAQEAREGGPVAGPARDRHVPAQGAREGGPVRLSGRHEFRDTQHSHDRVYPNRGYVVKALPREHRVVVHGRARYYFHGGVWYRPHGPRFTVVAPPFGLFVPFLPPYYATVWVGGTPYYYANQVYYVSQGSGYVVAEPPTGEVSQTPPQVVQALPPEAQPIPVPPPSIPPVDKLFIYPRQNQSEQQQATDRYECHKWAAGQTGFDPTQIPGSVPEDQKMQKRADYQRATTACLEGRGYTVR